MEYTFPRQELISLQEVHVSANLKALEQPVHRCAAGELTLEQIRRFREEGYLIVRGLLTEEALQPLIAELSRKVDEAIREAVQLGLLAEEGTFADAPFATRLALTSDACADRMWLWENYFSMQNPISAGVFALRTAAALLDAAESLIGPEILAHPQFALRTKLPDFEIMDIPWHQDLAHLVVEEAGDTLVVNFWVPLAKAGAENGCMQVIPGSHRMGLLHHQLLTGVPGHKGPKEIAGADLPPAEGVTCEVDVGDVLITSERLVHRSIPNRSNTVRWSVDTRYSRIGLPTGRSMVPGFVARSRRHPERVARSHNDWIRNLAEAGIQPWARAGRDSRPGDPGPGDNV